MCCIFYFFIFCRHRQDQIIQFTTLTSVLFSVVYNGSWHRLFVLRNYFSDGKHREGHSARCHYLLHGSGKHPERAGLLVSQHGSSCSCVSLPYVCLRRLKASTALTDLKRDSEKVDLWHKHSAALHVSSLNLHGAMQCQNMITESYLGITEGFGTDRFISASDVRQVPSCQTHICLFTWLANVLKTKVSSLIFYLNLFDGRICDWDNFVSFVYAKFFNLSHLNILLNVCVPTLTRSSQVLCTDSNSSQHLI